MFSVRSIILITLRRKNFVLMMVTVTAVAVAVEALVAHRFLDGEVFEEFLFPTKGEISSSLKAVGGRALCWGDFKVIGGVRRGHKRSEIFEYSIFGNVNVPFCTVKSIHELTSCVSFKLWKFLISS